MKEKKKQKQKSKWIYKTLGWCWLAAAAEATALVTAERCCTKFSIHAIITIGNDDLAFTNVYAECVCVCVCIYFLFSSSQSEQFCELR